MGSGETAPTMAKVHRALFERFGDEPAPAVLIDTPYGFQENADVLSERIVGYFANSVGRAMGVASYRRADAEPVDVAAAIARIREAHFVFAGPGSPSYALRHWQGGPVPEALADKLAGGGMVVMASAAAVTIGALAVPVYEIYKVGADPAWLDGLDLLAPVTGLRAAVIPHWDNAEGGDHDTRFCYLGERRLAELEALMPDDVFVLGVDGHTALVIDLEAGTAAVYGRGGVTVRVGGRSATYPAGSTVQLAQVLSDVDGLRSGQAPPVIAAAGAPPTGMRAEQLAIRDLARQAEESVVRAITERDAGGAVAALLELETAIETRTRAGEDSLDLDGARAVFRALLVRLGEAIGTAVPVKDAIDPFVAALLDVRNRARAERDWRRADLIRERLSAAGVEVHDDAQGSSTWSLVSRD
jgi:cyanophycinase-like exopeptidase